MWPEFIVFTYEKSSSTPKHYEKRFKGNAFVILGPPAEVACSAIVTSSGSKRDIILGNLL